MAPFSLLKEFIMANVSHALLTGSELHEPKGIENAALGEVYVANGSGSGSWNNIGASSFTGMIADFAWPVVQEGWLECDGSDVNTTTYAALYAAMTIQMSGTRVSGNNVITSLSSTANMRVGYYVFGTGIPSGTTIDTINSSTQITLSTNATSSGTSTVIVSPWLLNTGTIRLPDLSTAGRYRRSRTATTAVGQNQSSSNVAHTHGVSATTGPESADHTHQVSGTTTVESAGHSHTYTRVTETQGLDAGLGASTLGVRAFGSATTSNENSLHTHNFNVTSGNRSAIHTHSFSTTSASSGGTETRPETLVVMTCVKT
jgi:hypothetical protein